MYTYSVFCEAPTIFRSFRQVRRKVVGVFLFLAPGTFQSSDPGLTPSVPAIYSECLMAHPAVRLMPLCSPALLLPKSFVTGRNIPVLH